MFSSESEASIGRSGYQLSSAVVSSVGIMFGEASLVGAPPSVRAMPTAPQRRSLQSAGATLEDDAATLLRFKESGDPSTWPAAIEGWTAGSAASVCDWAGVACTDPLDAAFRDGERVTVVDFGYYAEGRGLSRDP